MKRKLTPGWPQTADGANQIRKGAFLVIAAVALVVVMAFVAMSVDLGYESMTQTRMQNATDTAALAAAMQITYALQQSNGNFADVFGNALVQARQTAFDVCQMNGIYIDKDRDVAFGQQSYNSSNGTYSYNWNVAANQVNTVKVTAHRDNPDTTAPDGKLPGIFSAVFSSHGMALTTFSTALIDPRDIVVVHDFSRSMNFDSYFTDEQVNGLSQSQIEANMQMVWDDLQPVNIGTMTYAPQYATLTQSSGTASATVTFKGKSVDISANSGIKTVKLAFSGTTSTQTFNISGATTESGNFAGSGSNSNRQIANVTLKMYKVGSTTVTENNVTYQYTWSTVRDCFGLASVSYPWARGSWSDYVNFVQTDGGLALYNHNHLYGGKTFVCYLLKYQSNYTSTKDLWKTRHYPFQAIKDGHEMLCDFLTNLGYGDNLGMVSYDSNHRIETTINDSNPDFPQVDISASPITNDYDAFKKLMHFKQASHYSNATNMAGGMKDGIYLLDNYRRNGARPAILLMTDGQANTVDSGENGNLPAGWDWNTLFDYDGDGVANYSTSNTAARCVLKYAKEAADKGYTVHTMCVGVSGDVALMEAVAWLGNGYALVVPGGTTVEQKQADITAAFAKIASAVPPARLLPPSN